MQLMSFDETLGTPFYQGVGAGGDWVFYFAREHPISCNPVIASLLTLA
jgi:hypothetical protein